VSSSPTETTFEVTMPQMGISVAEGTILEWRKRPGDWVEADETVCDASTDKVDVEIPAPAAGRLGRILVEPGETVPVGTVLAELDTAAKPGEAHPQESRAEELAGAAAAPVEQEIDRSRFYSPVVRRLADEHGIDLERVEGTGIGGRVRKRDLLAVLEDGAGGPTAPKQLHSESPYRPEPERTLPAAEPLIGPSRREPLSPMRLKIARHMLASRQTSAHCTTIVETDFSTVASRRAELREAMARKGVSLTYLAFVAKAAVAALEQHPVLNASIEDEEIVYHDDVNLGIAVALDEGLIVPVIRKAQRLSLEGMAAAIADLAARARERRLEPDEVGGGTFTITNPGQFGAVLATPIINQPQVAILDLEAIVKRPVVIEQDGAEAIAIRPISYLCMSWDHRALDGAEAARFLGVVKQRLESGRAD
jgi:2-oxoglutarate dehydrogenase complex dihydrolipoamide succinyltransferase (E2) component